MLIVARGSSVERRQGLGGAAQARLAGQGAALIDDRDDARPGRCTHAGPADHLPRALGRRLPGILPRRRRLVDLDSGIGVADEGDIGRAPLACLLDRLLITRLRLVLAITAATVRPGSLGDVAPRAAQGQRRPADRKNIAAMLPGNSRRGCRRWTRCR